MHNVEKCCEMLRSVVECINVVNRMLAEGFRSRLTWIEVSKHQHLSDHFEEE